ncbi:MAG TPA: hypothetical protein VGV93_04365 [Acidimicrobiales bacterium]|nr:hypothetical protein [Acidimicrobiales bacterium]
MSTKLSEGHPVSIRLHPDLHERLLNISRAQERPLSGSIRLAIRRFVEQVEAENRQGQPA